jgi:hypothetical protein
MNPIFYLRDLSYLGFMKSFTIKLLLFTALCAAFLYCWNQFTPEKLHDSLSWLILAFFASVTWLVHYYLIKSSAGDPKAFVGKFMGLTALKLFLYLTFLIIIFLADRDHARAVALYFLVMYLFFTVFEVSSLYNRLKK